MKIAITLLGKEAELYFLARCRCKAFYEIEEGAQSYPARLLSGSNQPLSKRICKVKSAL